MKKILTFITLCAGLLLCSTSCQKQEVDNTVTFKVNVVLPSSVKAEFSGKVVAENTTSKTTVEAEVVNNVATFTKVYPGVYDFSTSAELVSGEYSYIVSGTKKNVSIAKDDTGNVPDVNLDLTASTVSNLLISRVYANGTKKNGGSSYNMPKYWEIFNNSGEVVYLDGLCLAQVHGNTTSANTCQLYVTDKDNVYASRIARLPGKHGTDKNIALNPGKSLVIAWNAQNFIDNDSESAGYMTMNVDLTGADYEIYSTNRQWKENDNVPNMTAVYDCLPTAGFLQMNHALVIFFAEESEIEAWETGVDETSYTVASQKAWKAKKIPNSIVLDAMEIVKDGANQQKRIPDALDAAFIAEKNNNGSIVARKIKEIKGERIILVDTNSTKDDFVVIESSDAANFNGDHLKIRDYSNSAIQPK